MTEVEKIKVKNFSFYYSGSDKPTLKNINMPIYENRVIALIGPSGCGKTTLLRSFNRMHDLYPGNRYEGEILLDGENILSPDYDLIKLRTKVGMVFQKPTPFPMSIFDNVAYGLRLRGVRDKRILEEKVEKALRQA
ncbi:MAG: phosphate ABC transporter ATP-binding protein, partial [Persephonella sp.]